MNSRKPSSHTPDGLTLRLSSALSDIKYEHIPSQVVQLAAKHFTDCTGVAIAGGASEPGQIAAAVVSSEIEMEIRSEHAATLFSSGLGVAASSAAWANGIAAHALDFDDTGFSHPTACILPAVVAMAESVDASGPDVITAMVAGYEAFECIARAGREFEPNLRARGVHPTALYGSAAAAAGASRILGLDTIQTATAIGLALTGANGLSAQFGSWGKGLHAGNAARSGIHASRLAQKGYWAATNILEATNGFFRSVFPNIEIDPETVISDDNRGWALVNPGLNIKAYPACGRTLRAIDAALALRRNYIPDPGSITKVEVETYPDYIHTLPYRAPVRGFQGKFSLDYCVAISLLDGHVNLDSFTDSSANRAELRQIIDVTEIVVRDDWGPENRRKNPVTVILQDGSEYSETVINFWGSAQNPMTNSNVLEKFVYCLDVGGYKQSPEIGSRFLQLEKEPSLRAIMVDLLSLRTDALK